MSPHVPVWSVALLLSVPLIAPSAAAVVGGQDATAPYDFMVHVFQKGDPSDNDASSGGFICGGFLAAPTIVVTAGHCLESVADRIPLAGPIASGGPYERPQALIGALDRSQPGETIDIVAMHQHPQWMIGPGFGVNDIGVFELATPSTKTPVRLAAPGDERLYPAGTPATVLGWGWDPDVLPDQLQELTIPVHGDLDCKLRPQYVILFSPEHELCAGAAGQDSCGGDSGGPLFVRDGAEPVVIGVVSWGSQTGECGDPMHPGVYLEVSAYEDWLAPFVEA